MMKPYFLFLFFFFIACRANDANREKRIFIADLSNYFDSKGNLHLDGRPEPVFFSRSFWEYFTRKYPQASAIIFFADSADQNKLLHLNDTSLAWNTLDIITRHVLMDQLPMQAGEKERYKPGNIERDEDDSSNKSIPDTLAAPLLTKNIQSEYHQFLQMVSDTSHYPIIIFKKSFVRELDSLYR